MRIDNIIVDKERLAQLFGVSTITIDGWIRADMPVARQGGKGVSYQFNTADVINWVRERERARGMQGGKVGGGAAPADDPRTRQAMAQAKMKELELAERQGELLPADQVLAKVEDEYAAVRARLLLIPARVAPLVASTQDHAECEKHVADEVHEALRELSSGHPGV